MFLCHVFVIPFFSISLPGYSGGFHWLEYVFLFFLAALGLCCCARAFSSCGERGATLRCSVRASHCGGFSCCGARAVGARASVVAVHGLSSCGSRVQVQ